MSRSELIGVVGVIVGLPGLLALIFSGSIALAVMAGCCLLILFVAIRTIRRLLKSPPFLMKRVDVKLLIKDAQGSLATLSKEYLIVPMFEHLTEIAHRNIAADGVLDNICWDGKPVPPGQIKTVMGERQVSIKFPGPLERRKEFSGCLSYDVHNSFPAQDERLIYVVDFPAAVVTLKVVFPANRVATAAFAFHVQGSGKSPLKEAPKLDRDAGTIEIVIRKPRVGDEYELAWTW